MTTKQSNKQQYRQNDQVTLKSWTRKKKSECKRQVAYLAEDTGPPLSSLVNVDPAGRHGLAEANLGIWHSVLDVKHNKVD